MTVTTFGVDAGFVRRHYYPQQPDFSTDSNPTEATVLEKIDGFAADLEGKLARESITASAITTVTDAAYLWCRKTLALMVAIEIYPVMTGNDSAAAKKWQKELDARLKDLSEDGFLALGGGVAAPTEEPDGPTHFIDNLGLDTSENEANASSVDMPFHKDDRL